MSMKIDSRAMEVLGERIAEHAAHLDAATHRLLTDIREFDEKGGWYAQGALSCAHWLAWRVGWDLVTARERVRVAGKLGGLPLIDDALRRGELSYSKARAITRVATPDTEALLLAYAEYMTGSQLDKTTRKWKSVARHAAEGLREDPERRHVRRRELDDGMTRIEATLHPDEAELVWAMLTAAEKRRHASAEAPAGFNRANALVELAQAYLRGDAPERAPVDVVLTIPRAAVEQRSDVVGLLGNAAVSVETSRRLCCDAGVVEIEEDERGNALSVGRKWRTFSGALKRALLHRDRCCTFPGCTNELYLEGHHLKHWIDGGETSIDNGALLCSTHHRFVHEYGFTITLDETGHPRFRDPKGRQVRNVPAPTRVTELGWPTIHRGNTGLGINAATNIPKWDGRPVDYGLVIDGLVGAEDSAEAHRAASHTN
jgi:uncharacterized protein DUF222/HNH endonuclease